jgi:hypothetical protein
MQVAPKRNTVYYKADANASKATKILPIIWSADDSDLKSLEFGLCHLTPKNAFIHSQALRSFTEIDTSFAEDVTEGY